MLKGLGSDEKLLASDSFFFIRPYGEPARALLLPDTVWDENHHEPGRFVDSIRQGEEDYHGIISRFTDQFHVSRTHSYAVLGISATILSRWLTSPSRLFVFYPSYDRLSSADSTKILQWAQRNRVSLTLFSHWIDDQFDSIYVTQLRGMIQRDGAAFLDRSMESILEEMSPLVLRVWSAFLEHYRTYPFFNEKLYRRGMMMLLFGGPLSSTKLRPSLAKQEVVERLYLKLLMKGLGRRSPWRAVIRWENREILFLMTKTVQEMFDAFIPKAPEDVVMVENVLYSLPIACEDCKKEQVVEEAGADYGALKPGVLRLLNDTYQIVGVFPPSWQRHIERQLSVFLTSFYGAEGFPLLCNELMHFGTCCLASSSFLSMKRDKTREDE